jgi:hypothetical protein
MKLKKPRDGYVRCETLMPILGCLMLQHREMPTHHAVCLYTEDGVLTLRVTAESAQSIADMLARSAADMRKAS